MGQSQSFNNSLYGGTKSASNSGLLVNGYFRIRSYVNNQAVSYNRESKLVLESPSDKYHQQWLMDRNGRIINRFNAMDLIVTGNNNGAPIILKKMASDLTAQWRIDNTGSIISKYNEHLITFDDNGKIPYLYSWESFEGNSQKWYFEVMDDQKWTTKIVKGIKGKSGPIEIPNLMLRPSVNFSYYGWIRSLSNNPIVSLTKGNMLLNLNSKSSTINNGKFQIETDNSVTTCMFTYKPNKSNQTDSDNTSQWIHLGLVVSDQTILVYIDGKLIKSCTFNDLITLNTNPLNLQGQFRNLNYCNFAISFNTILSDYQKLKLHAPVTEKKQKKHVQTEQEQGHKQHKDKKHKDKRNNQDKHKDKDKRSNQEHRDKNKKLSPTSVLLSEQTNSLKSDFQSISSDVRTVLPSTSSITSKLSSNESIQSHLPSGSSVLSAVIPSISLITSESNRSFNQKTLSSQTVKFLVNTNGQRANCKSNSTTPDSTGYWCALAPDQKYYFELDLQSIYNLDSITTSKYSTTEWIRTYKLLYLDTSSLKWVKYDVLSLGNENINLKTQKLRVIPLTWNNWPAVKIKLHGNPSQPTMIDFQNQVHSELNTVWKEHSSTQQETMSMVLTSLNQIQTQLNAINNHNPEHSGMNPVANKTYLNELSSIQKNYEQCKSKFT